MTSPEYHARMTDLALRKVALLTLLQDILRRAEQRRAEGNKRR